jgi:uncharacterized protein YggT (Ycf19 family)
VSFILFVLNAIEIVIIVDAISSWFIPAGKFPRNITATLTEPLYAPLRKLLGANATGGVDWVPLILLVALNLLGNVLSRGI